MILLTVVLATYQIGTTSGRPSTSCVSPSQALSQSSRGFPSGHERSHELHELLKHNIGVKAKDSDWPMQEMAENLERIFNKRSFEKSEFTLDFLLKILKQCHKDENKHEAETKPFRDNSEYKRSTEETNAIAKKFKIAKRMKLMIRSLGSKDMDRSTTSIIDGIVDSSCRHLLSDCDLESCDFDSEFRTISGCCNNQIQPDFGRRFLPLIRLLPPEYQDGESLPRGGLETSSLPSPREISIKVHQNTEHLDKQVSLMIMQFGQYISHDISLTPEQSFDCSNERMLDKDLALSEDLRVCFNIPVEEKDPFFAGRVRSLPFSRSDGICNSNTRQQFNALTAYIDASQVYGSDIGETFAWKLRTFKDGLMKNHRLGPSLPTRSQTDVPLKRKESPEDLVAGDMRAIESPGLASIHSLFHAEHNRIARQILALNPGFDDEQIYQHARKWVIAELQNIAYSEFLPSVLGATIMEEYGMFLPTDGSSTYDDTVDPSVSNEFATLAFRFGHTMIPNFFKTIGETQRSTSKICPLRHNFFQFEDFVLGTDKSGKAWENLLNGIASSTGPACSPKFTDDLLNFLFCGKGDQCSLKYGWGEDLAARNIQRGRDHGLPGYVKYRELCGLSVPSSWDDKPDDIPQKYWDNLQLAYDKVEDIDAFTGGVSEEPTEYDRIVGATFACIIAKQFKILKEGDRFFFTHENNGSKNEKGISVEVRSRTQVQSRRLSDVMCDNMEIDSIKEYVFKYESDMLNCNDRVELDLSQEIICNSK